ncbi:unnamed protein product [Hydatigera taeniaeformis]|uniref:RRM domain-containing protein n=1 Tax=Hydatigena taeniaeformis TaxID=6205 RepID=A0A3P7F6F0_HYDTA|nr:unnamed protein product [Hydatigera taeniaeformis]
MEKAMMIKRWLEELLDDAKATRPMMERALHLPITQMSSSDKYSKLIQSLKEFNLVVADDSVSPPQPQQTPNRRDIGRPSENATSFSSIAVKSRVKPFLDGLQKGHTEGQLRQHFAQYGTLTECSIARDYNTDESRGLGFVAFSEVEDASRALAASPYRLNDSLVYARPYKLRTVKEKGIEEALLSSCPANFNWAVTKFVGRFTRGETLAIKNDVLPIFVMRWRICCRNGDESGEKKDEDCKTSKRRRVNETRLFVRYPNLSTSQQTMKEYFSQFGNVKHVILVLDKKTKMPQGTAFVDMATSQEVETVLEARPHQLNGESIVVKQTRSRQR